MEKKMNIDFKYSIEFENLKKLGLKSIYVLVMILHSIDEQGLEWDKFYKKTFNV